MAIPENNPNEPLLIQKQPALASKGKRFTAGLIDLILVPVLLGAFITLFTFWFLGPVANVIFYFVYVIWVIFRDTVFSPGRTLVGIRLISLEGNGKDGNGKEVTVIQAIKRNLLIILPFVGIIGYAVEIISLIIKGERVMDPWANTKVIDAEAKN